MKRIIPLILTLSVLLTVFFTPTRVLATVGSSVNIMEFTSANGSNSNTVPISVDNPVVTFDMQDTVGWFESFYFEVYLTWTYYRPTACAISNGGSLNKACTITDVSSKTIKISGNLDGYDMRKYILTFTTPGYAEYTFHSFDVDLIRANRVNIGATVSVSGGSTKTLSPGGSVENLYAPNNVTAALFSVRIPYSSWSNFDEIDLSGYIANGQISTITANITTDSYIPVSLQPVISMSARSIYYYSMSLDLSDVSVSSGDLVVWFNCDVITSSCHFGVWGLSGVIASDPYPVSSVWSRLIYDRLAVINSSISTMHLDLYSRLGLVKSAIDDASSAITSAVSSASSSITSAVNNASTAISNAVNTVSSRVLSLSNNLLNWYNGLTLNLRTWFTDVSGKLQALIDGQAVDQGVTDGMQQAEDELGNMTDQMENLSPTINSGDVNVDVDDLVSQEGVSSVTSVFSIFTGNAFISVMLTIVIGMATAGYVFFGKR